MAKRRLPTGIQTFREIRESDCYYVDKTGYALRLFHGGKHFLLSRPRRFGKSLFVDTLKHLFEGDQELFVGLEHGLLRTGDLDGLQTWFRALFAGIPYQWHSRNTIADYEGYYASVFYSFFVGSGAAVTAEDSGSAGRADLAVQTAGRMYLFEFKVFAAAQRGAAAAPRSEVRSQVPPPRSANPFGRGRIQCSDTCDRSIRERDCVADQPTLAPFSSRGWRLRLQWCPRSCRNARNKPPERECPPPIHGSEAGGNRLSRDCLEDELQADLQVARAARAGDDAEVPIPNLHVREVELRCVGYVERLKAELCGVLLAEAELLVG